MRRKTTIPTFSSIYNLRDIIQGLTGEQKFFCSIFIVNIGNYLYNLILGRMLGPAQFSDAALLVTFLLGLSFIAMTFQLTTAKFSVIYENDIYKKFINTIYRYSLFVGLILAIACVFFAKDLQLLFHTETYEMFVVFGLGIPIYLVMSINRGVFQGIKKLEKLSLTYQSEMISRLLLTIILIYTMSISSSILIAIGICISFIFGLFPFQTKEIATTKTLTLLSFSESKNIIRFFVLTAFYELTQIIINNSDIVIVKHYFGEYEAGLYASLSLIGRMVYFAAWMFVMLLLPKVVRMQKEGVAHAHVLFKYVFYITSISLIIVLGCYFFPELIVEIMFGSAYTDIAPLLWKYGIATSLFAISNIFTYYFLSLDEYIPVVLSAILGILQVILVIFYHNSLAEVVYMQIIAMLLLFLFQVLFFWRYNAKKKIIN